MLERFTKTYPGEYIHTTLVRHDGILIGFAMDAEARIFYAVLDLAGEVTGATVEQTATRSMLDVDSWPAAPRELIFPNEIAEVGFGVAGQVLLPVFRRNAATAEKPGIPLPDLAAGQTTHDSLRSTTARLGAAVPFQVLSDGTHIYIFRQAVDAPAPDDDSPAARALRSRQVFIDAKSRVITSADGSLAAMRFVDDSGPKPVFVQQNGRLALADPQAGQPTPLVNGTLLADRFILAGTELRRTIEVRYQRSRSKARPASRKDSLGPRDLDGNFFYEPTQELRFVRDLTGGRFTALLVPTAVAELSRWQLFTHNARTDRVDALSVERSSDGLFNTRGTQAYTCEDHPEVFTLREGRCSEPRLGEPSSVCDKELVPRLASSGRAESALSFQSDGARIALSPPAPVETAWTLELWLQPNRPRSTVPQTLVAPSGPNGLEVAIQGGSRLLVSYGAAGQRHTLPATRALLAANDWNHLAITCDGQALRFFVGARLREKIDLPAPPAQGGIAGFGAAQSSFVGVLDEVRLWDRPRSARELRADMGMRLTGLEPGLAGYWRLDEADGDPDADGDPIFDQAGGADGVARSLRWVTSDAPIGEGPGLSRDSFRVVSRDVAGVAQPRDIASGPASLLYFQQSEAPSGYDGRKKPLKQSARVMLAFATSGGQRPHIAALDFGVAVDGRLAHTPDRLELPTIDADRSDPRPVSEQIDALATLEDTVRALADRVRDAQATLVAVQAALDEMPDPTGLRVELFQEVRFQGPSVAFGPNTPTTVSPFRSVRVPRGLLARLNIQSPGGVTGVELSSDQASITSIPSNSRITLHVVVVAGYTEERARRVTRVAQTATDLAAAQTQLADVQTRRAAAHAELLGGAQVPMNLRHIDGRGLTISGGLLGFAWTTSVPTLFDSAAGRIALGFRGADDQLFVTYYTAFTQRAQYPLRDTRGEVSITAVARSAELNLDSLTIEVTGEEAAPTCTVAINGAGIDETWTHVPRDPQSFAKVLNGEAGGRERIGVGQLVRAGETLRLVFERAVGRTIRLGTTLMVGDTRVTTLAELAAGTQPAELPVETTASSLPPGALPVFLLEYDYVTMATTTRVPADLYNGSLLVRAVVMPVLAASIQVGQKATSGATLSSTWTAAAPGTTLVFDGQTTHAAAPETLDLARLDAPDDLTVEAWARPSLVRGTSRVLTHRTDASRYALALEERPLVTALALDSVDDLVRVPDHPALSFTGAVTLEAWVKPETADGTRYIVVHGHPFEGNELFLRMENGQYQAGVFINGGAGNILAQMAIPAADVLGRDWVHLAGVYDVAAQQWRLYRNGVLGATHASGQGAFPITGHWGIGGNPNPSATAAQRRFFKGAIDEVRVWRRARSADEIAADMARRLVGNETDLMALWSFGGGQAPDAGRHAIHGTVIGGPQAVAGPISGYVPAFAAGGAAIRGKRALPVGRWTHLAAVFEQSYAARFDRSGYLDAGNDSSLDLTRNLTIEVFLHVENPSLPEGIIARGQFDDGPGNEHNGVPYALSVLPGGTLFFRYEDVDGTIHEFRSSRQITNGIHKIAVSRERVSETGAIIRDGDNVSVPRRTYDRVRFTIDGQAAGENPAPNFSTTSSQPAEIRSSRLPVLIGAEQRAAESQALSLRGVISELRIWSEVRPASQIGQSIRGDEQGLISWWRFEEGRGRVAEDAKSRNHAVFKGEVNWVKDPDPNGSRIGMLVDGAPVETEAANAAALDASQPQFALGALIGAPASQRFRGELEDVRVWRMVRAGEQIQDNLFRRLDSLSEGEELLAHYTFDAEQDGRLSDRTVRASHLAVSGTASYILSSAPVGDDAPQLRSALAGVRTPFSGRGASAVVVQEYADLQLDAAGNLLGVLKRAYSYLEGGAWQLVTGFKAGDLATEWVGQVQFAPQLIGFIEGAPPVPSENLTQSGVSLPGDIDDYNEASTVELVEAEATTLSYSAERNRGFDMTAEIGLRLGFLSDSDAGFGAISSIEDSQITAGAKASFEFSKGWIDEAGSSGQVTTGRTTSLELRGRYATAEEIARTPGVGRRFIPDNGGLALVKSLTADVFALRLKSNGALVAFRMRPNLDIPADYNIISFPINPRYTKQGTLDGKIGLLPDADYPDALAPSSDSSYFKPREAYDLKGRIQREETRLRAQFEQFDAAQRAHRENATHFQAGDFGSQALAPLLPSLAKRNIVNTYVWSADGGLFAETQETMDTISETAGGDYSFKGMAGLEATFMLFAAKVGGALDLSAMFGGHLNLTVKKAKEAKRSFALNVGLPRVERDLYARDEQDEIILDLTTGGVRPRRVPGKVDAYRFMSFYLEPQAENADLFFNRVVDPVWLAQSDEPAAAALREANQPDRRPAAWRIMHRVTFVSRVLPEIQPGAPPSMERTLKDLNLDSNFELVRALDPYVSTHLGSFTEFNDAVRAALRLRLPELLGQADEVVRFLAQFYGFAEGHGAPVEDESIGGGALEARPLNQPPVVAAGQTQILGLDGDRVVATLEGSVVDDRLENETQLFVTWELVSSPQQISGPPLVTFADRHSATTTATFTQRGRYLLRLTASDGERSASDDLAVIVNVRPTVSAGPNLSTDGRAVLLTGIVMDGLGDPGDPAGGALKLTWSLASRVGAVTFAKPDALSTSATFGEAGSYLLKLTADNGTFSADDEVMVSVAARAVEGLAALYTFQEGQGATVRDVSGAGEPLDLVIGNPAVAEWIDGGLALRGPAAIQTPAAASRLSDAVRASRELAVEAWVKPAAAQAAVLAPIVALGRGPTARHMLLAQVPGSFYGAVRTQLSGPTGGDRPLAGGAVGGELTHVVLTRAADQTARLFVNGEQVAERTLPGDLSTWDGRFALALGGEAGETVAERSWRGALHLVALYTRALSPAEVRRHHQLGADTDLPPLVSAGGALVVNWPNDRPEPITARLRGRVTHDRPTTGAFTRWEQTGGPGAPGGVSFADESDPTTEAIFPSHGRYTLRLTADDGRVAASDEALVVVSRPLIVALDAPQLVELTGQQAEARLRATITPRGLGHPEGTLAVRWRRLSGPNSAQLASPDAAETTVRFTQRGVYAFECIATVTAASGNLVTSTSVTVTVNQRATIEAGAPVTISVPPAGVVLAEVPLRGSVIDSGLGDGRATLPVRWSLVSGPTQVTFGNQASPQTTASFTANGVYVLRLSAGDGGLVVHDELPVTINRTPAVILAPTHSVVQGEELLLQAVVLDDGLPQAAGLLGIQWRTVSGPSQPSFGSAQSEATTVRFAQPGTYVLSVTVADGAASSEARTSVTVQSARVPVDGGS